MWDAPSLCEGWRTREVVAHVTMPARYAGPAFMAELEAAGGDFTRLSNTVAARDGALGTGQAARRPALRGRCTAGSRLVAGPRGRTHPLRHPRSSTSSSRCRWRDSVPPARLARVLAIVANADPDAPNLFGVDLTGVELRADDLDWSFGTGPTVVSGPAQALALVACGRLLPAGRLHGEAAARFSR